MELLLLTRGENKHYVVTKDFDQFIGCRYCLQASSSAPILGRQLGRRLSKSDGVQAVEMAKKGST